MQLASASSNYTKPEAGYGHFLQWMGEEPLPLPMIERRESLCKQGNGRRTPQACNAGSTG